MRKFLCKTTGLKHAQNKVKMASKVRELGSQSKDYANKTKSAKQIREKDLLRYTKYLLGPLFTNVQSYIDEKKAVVNRLHELHGTNQLQERIEVFKNLRSSYKAIHKKRDEQEKTLNPNALDLSGFIKQFIEQTSTLIANIQKAVQFCLNLDDKETIKSSALQNANTAKQTLSDAANIAIIRAYLQLIVSAVYDSDFETRKYILGLSNSLKQWENLQKQNPIILSELSKHPLSSDEINYLDAEIGSNEPVGSQIDMNATYAGIFFKPLRDSLTVWKEGVKKIIGTLNTRFETTKQEVYFSTLLFALNKFENEDIKDAAKTDAKTKTTAEKSIQFGTSPCRLVVEDASTFYMTHNLAGLRNELDELKGTVEQVCGTLEQYLNMDEKATFEFCNSIHVRRKHRTLFRTMQEIYYYFKDRFDGKSKRIAMSRDPNTVSEVKSAISDAKFNETVTEKLLQEESVRALRAQAIEAEKQAIESVKNLEKAEEDLIAREALNESDSFRSERQE